MKSKALLPIILVLAFIGVILLAQTVFVVDEKEQVIITQFGKPVGEPITTPGLHFKTPFTQTANFFEKRYMEWDGDPNQVPTKDKKFIFIDTYARWQITDPLQFFKRLKNENGAQSRLDDILDGETRNFIANHNIEEAVRSNNRVPEVDSLSGIISDTLITIRVGRERIQEMILSKANEQARELGIEVLDFRFKRINYVEEVQARVYERMKTERFQIADKFRSEGAGEASRINGEKERELKTIQSEAFRTAEEIQGRADGAAAAVYANAYNRSGQSRKLYKFLKSMETLESTMNGKTKLILTSDSDLFKYLKSTN